MRSEEVKLGSTRAAHRSLFYAMGYTEEDLKKPLIGVVNAQNEIIPGHMHLDQIAKAVKHGILAAGGTPIEFPAIGICDGIAMGHNGMKYPLASRELVADSIEAVANGHAFDGLVLIPNCDKIVPGMLMAAARLNIPAIVVSGGPMLRAILEPMKLHNAIISSIFDTTPWLNGNETFILGGTFSNISNASSPIATGRLSFPTVDTTFFSRRIIPCPFLYILMVSVPKSIP